MKKLVAVLSLLVIFFSSNAQGDSAFIRQVANEMLTNSKAYDNLRELTKKIGGRLAGSPQMIKAENWGKKALEIAGADKVWLQETLVPHWIRGGKDEVKVFTGNTKSASKTLDVLALGNSMGSGLQGITAPVIEVASFDDLEAKKDQVKGKIVFYNYKFKPTFVETFLSYADAVQYRGAGPSRAAKYGAVAIIVRSMSHSTDNFPHTGATRYDSAYPKIPAVAVGLQDADWLSAELKKTQASIFLRTNGQFLPDTIGHNVIGEITGSDPAAGYITVGGHLDSWDPAEGAHDDGAGIVQTIEILRAFKAVGFKPKHTIRFVLFANEENGTRGGLKYAAEAKAKNEKHVFALESDAGGFTPRGFGFEVTDDQFKVIQPWSALLLPYGGGELVRGGDGSDIGPLRKALGTATAGLNPDSQRYFDYHHARNDVFENVNKRELELGAVNMAALLYLVDKYGM